MRRNRAAVPHSVRAGVALSSGGERATTATTGRVSVVDEINKGIADVIVYEPRTLGARPLAIAQ